ncbi:MAG: DUF433 domain-containing protein [Caldilineaceae bacterium]|nr:DUF433 domain-containing protein [Caldilineaceae bacterium]
MKQHSEIVRDPDILGGTPVFRGTRVPVQALLDYFSGGQSLNEFLDDFPSVTHDQAVEVLEEIKTDLVAAGHEDSAR